MGDWPSQAVNNFRAKALPERATPVGYAALIAAYDLALPLPPRLAAIAERHHPVTTAEWIMFTPRHRPEPSLAGHLTFAIKWEGIDLSILARLFQTVEPGAVADLVRATPTGAFARRIWFLYEWLTGQALDVPDAGKVRTVSVVDPEQQFALDQGEPSPRHRVLNNLPGTPSFCPMIRRSAVLVEAAAKKLDARARAQIGRVRPDLIARAAAFLLLNDSKSSFAIEGERPSGTRAVRWGQAIAEAGNTQLSLSEFDRLQRIVIGDARFVRLGLRDEGGFVGVHDRETGARRARMLRTAMGVSIATWLADPQVIEIMLNPDGRLWVDRLGIGLSDSGERLTAADGERIIRLVAHHVGAEVHGDAPRVSAELPESGERFEGLLPPVVAAPTFAIRKPAVAVFLLEDYVSGRNHVRI
jgi:hypothetical protein